VEFTWSLWINILSVDKATGTTITNTYKNVFNKGNNIYFSNGGEPGSSADGSPGCNWGKASVNNGPGLYIGDLTSDSNTTANKISAPQNALLFILDVENTSGGANIPIQILIPNVPMQKWFHVAYILKNYTLSCYVNGVIANSVSLGKHVPKQNYDDVYVCQNGGFNGSLSNLRYYDSALSAFDINAIVGYGPNLTPSNFQNKSNSIYDYLGMSWYTAMQ
jgi:hypothetical protein